jgi:hypothetical protein
MSRFLIALGVLAISVRAQDEGILTASGDDLSSFRIRLHTDQIDRRTPKSFVGAHTKFLVEMENEVAQRFAELVADEHTAILKRYYTGELVKMQETAYTKHGKRSRQLAFAIEDVKVRGDRAAVTVKVTWEQMKKGTDSTYIPAQRRERLQLARKGGSWWLDYVEKEVRGKGFEAQKIQVRPRVLAPKISFAGAPNTTSPDQTLKSLEIEMRRFRGLRRNGQYQLYSHYLAFLEAFYGSETAQKARKVQQTDLEATTKYMYTLAKPDKGGMRIDVSLFDMSTGPRETPVGKMAYWLRREGKEWRVFSEAAQNKPDGPFTPISAGFAIPFSR